MLDVEHVAVMILQSNPQGTMRRLRSSLGFKKYFVLVQIALSRENSHKINTIFPY